MWTTEKAIVSTLLTRHVVELDPSADFDTTLVSSLTVPENGVAATVRRGPLR